jgi:GAF domain-containing protein/anti-sigma regulatory factor (Ser/Thr protein kinase)
MQLCDGKISFVFLFDGEWIRLPAISGMVAEGVEAIRKVFPIRPGSHSVSARTIRDGTVVHVPDVLADPEYLLTDVSKVAGYRSVLSVPMLRAGRIVGGIAVARAEVGLFSDKRVELLKTFADQAVIAIENVRLFKELQARNAEITEALEQQTVTAGILKVISGSPTDTQPVFDAIVKSGAQLFGGAHVALRLAKGDQITTVASTRPLLDVHGRFPARLNDDRTPSSRAMLRREVVQVPDILAPDAEDWVGVSLKQRAEQRGYRAILSAPMLRDNAAVGAINVLRATPGPFSDKQIALLKTFADQAVIAIENVRLFKELQARNAEITEALERQTATSEILSVISQSPTDVAPVFETIMNNAARLCGSPIAAIYRFDGELVHLAATHNWPPEALAGLTGRYPCPPNPAFVGARAVLAKSIVRLPDALADPDYDSTFAAMGGWRRTVGVPLMRGETPVGAFAVAWPDPGETPESQVALLKTFADQAVIAIENVRLFKELQARNAEITEALEQQTATSEILRVISSSPTDLQPVFDTILDRAIRLCEGNVAVLWQYDREHLHFAAHHNSPEENVAYMREHPLTPGTYNPTPQAALERRTVHVLDVFENPEYRALIPPGTSHRRPNAPTVLAVPLQREDDLFGVITIWRYEKRLFTEKQVALVTTFASQAIIAIQNVRLFKELQARNAEITEALERQTATSEILRVISQSPTDVVPVFETIMKSAARLCSSTMGVIYRFDGDLVHLAATHNWPPEALARVVSQYPSPPQAAVASGRAILTKSIVTIPDALVDAEYDKGRATTGGWRRIISVPLMRGDTPVGAFAVAWPDPGEIPESQVALLKTFADQAVIAIENVRLFKELQARNAEITESLERQTATSNVLKIISRSTFDLGPVLETLVENARKLCDADTATIARADKDGNYVPVAMSALEPRPELLAYAQRHPIRPDRGTAVGRALLDRRPVHIPDALADPDYTRTDLVALRDFRSILAVPMLREGEPIGVFGLTRTKEVRPFTDKQIELVTTFADQAVIAIENVRLFNEIQDKGHQLEVANRHKSQFLANMSHELRTPLNCINGFSEMLLARMFGDLNEKQEEFLRDINSSGEHLLSLINDVLDLSKIEAGRMELHLTAFDPGATIDNSVMLVKERASRRGIAVSVEVDEKLDRWVGDERKIRQVILNLLSNAVKFTPEGGRIDIRARREGDEMVVAVSDTGIGIKPEDQARIFEEFQQAGTDYTKKAEGTGLGLALSRKFVELHGGAIKVESVEGKGSTFTFSIPEMQEVTA